MYRSEYPNGAVIFCSETVAEAIHPPQILSRRLYSCGRHFDTSLLREQLRAESTPDYGIIVIDGSDACIGTAKGLGATAKSASAVTSLAQLSSTTASKTRRGGQSASRYSRLRDEADLAFLRRVAERATSLLGAARGIVLAGKADAKKRLLPELSMTLQSRVLCSLTLPCDANIEGLRLAALRAADVFASDLCREQNQALCDFMDLMQSTVGASEMRVCYGSAQTLSALSLGAVETLLLGEAEDVEKWRLLADGHGTQIVEVERRSEQAVQFCDSFRVGGCLRWPVDLGLMEEECQRDAEASTNKVQMTSVDSEAASSSTDEPSEAPGAVHLEVDGDLQLETSGDFDAAADADGYAWLEEEIANAFGDRSTAQALVAGVEAILDDDLSQENDALTNAVDMLIGEGVPQHIVDKLIHQQ